MKLINSEFRDKNKPVWVIEIDRPTDEGLHWFQGVTVSDLAGNRKAKEGRIFMHVWTIVFNDLELNYGMWKYDGCKRLLATVLKGMPGCRIINWFERHEYLETYQRPPKALIPISSFKPN